MVGKGVCGPCTDSLGLGAPVLDPLYVLGRGLFKFRTGTRHRLSYYEWYWFLTDLVLKPRPLYPIGSQAPEREKELDRLNLFGENRDSVCAPCGRESTSAIGCAPQRAGPAL